MAAAKVCSHANCRNYAIGAGYFRGGADCGDHSRAHDRRKTRLIACLSSSTMDSFASFRQALQTRIKGMAPITPAEYASVLIVALLSYFLYKYATRDPRLAHLPPHVRGWPIINQTLDHLEEDPTGKIIQWARDYGEIFRTTAATTTFIWINSREAFKELIDRRSAIYSSRHPQPMTLDMASAGKRITFMPYGKEWRALRNIMHKVMPHPHFRYSLAEMFMIALHSSNESFVYSNTDLRSQTTER